MRKQNYVNSHEIISAIKIIQDSAISKFQNFKILKNEKKKFQH